MRREKMGKRHGKRTAERETGNRQNARSYALRLYAASQTGDEPRENGMRFRFLAHGRQRLNYLPAMRKANVDPDAVRLANGRG